MRFFSDLFGMLVFRERAFRAAAERQTILWSVVCFSAGFVSYALVRNRVYAGFPGIMDQPSGPIHFLYHLNLVQSLLFVLLIYVPVLIFLSNAISGMSPRLAVSLRDYRMRVSVLLPLWGLLFLITAPLQWIVPHFLIIGMFEISVGFLIRSLLLSLYTIWSVRHLNSLNGVQASGVFLVSLVSLSIMHLLAA